MTHLAILTVRNEGAFLVEWLAHHKAVGFNDFLIFSNDCDDGTDAILDRLDALGHITHVPNPGPYDKGGIQFTALKAAAKLDIVKQADWILPLDVDEFVNIHTGDGTVSALHDALPDADAITLTWRLFGNAGKLRFKDAPITEQFTRAAPIVMHWPWRAAMFKTLYKNNGVYRKPGVHRPRDADDDAALETRWFDGEGRALPDQFKTRRIFSNYGRSNYALVQLNHYPLLSAEDYVLKADRGRAVHSDQLLGLDYWTERNWNTDEDLSIARYTEKRRQIQADLMQDSTLKSLHDAAATWRTQRFESLLEQEPFRALFARILMTSPSRPIPAEVAQTLVQYANRGRNKDNPA